MPIRCTTRERAVIHEFLDKMAAEILEKKVDTWDAGSSGLAGDLATLRCVDLCFTMVLRANGYRYLQARLQYSDNTVYYRALKFHKTRTVSNVRARRVASCRELRLDKWLARGYPLGARGGSSATGGSSHGSSPRTRPAVGRAFKRARKGD